MTERPSLPAGALTPATFKTVVIDLPAGATEADLQRPSFWARVADQLNVNDLVHVHSADGEINRTLEVAAKTADGLVMEPWPRLPPELSHGQVGRG